MRDRILCRETSTIREEQSGGHDRIRVLLHSIASRKRTALSGNGPEWRIRPDSVSRHEEQQEMVNGG
ncbi:MAG: hypothetical protein WC382_10840 [Methanoregulaceae archaeon]